MVPVPGPQVVEAYNVVPSTKAPQVLFSYYDLLTPDHVEVLMDYALTMVDQAPDNAVSLDPIHGVVARLWPESAGFWRSTTRDDVGRSSPAEADALVGSAGARHAAPTTRSSGSTP